MKKLTLLVLIIIAVVSCSKMNDQDYLNRAESEVKDKKINEAVADLQTLLKEFPESKLAPKALVQLATIYQGQLVKGLTMRESFDKSQKYFKEVYDKYQNSEEAPSALFMSSFILANHLHRFDEATAGYKLFIEKYPDNPLVVSAKDELDNMGLSPEEILKKKEVAKN
jgi:TolA-binding protein